MLELGHLQLTLEALTYVGLPLVGRMPSQDVTHHKPVTARKTASAKPVTARVKSASKRRKPESKPVSKPVSKPESGVADTKEFLRWLLIEDGSRQVGFVDLSFLYQYYCDIKQLQPLGDNVWSNQLIKLGISKKLKRVSELGVPRKRMYIYDIQWVPAVMPEEVQACEAEDKTADKSLSGPKARDRRRKAGVRPVTASVRRQVSQAGSSGEASACA